MQTRVALASFLWLLPALAVGSDSTAFIRGLDPALAAKYVANAAGKFVCLDGSKEIPFAQVNDDYCDCADGSDEPGTSACNNGTFYCANEGHIAAHIGSSKVNDGICDPQCCDGSDEWDSGITCANVCGEIGQKHREREAQAAQQRDRGGQRLVELVREASGLRKIKREELGRKQEKLRQAELQVAAAEKRKGELEEHEHAMRESLDHDREQRKQAVHAEYLPDLITHRRHLAATLHKSRWQRDSLIMLLRSVRLEHNAEFNDAAVLEAVKEYVEFADAYPYLENAAVSVMEQGESARAAREAEMDADSERQDDSAYDACRDAIKIAESERDTNQADIDLLYGLLDKLRSDYNKNYHDLAIKAAVVGLGEYELMRDSDQAEIAKQHDELNIAHAQKRVTEAAEKLEKILDEADHGSTAADGDAANAAAGQPDAEFQQKLADARSEYYSLTSEKSSLANDVSVTSELLEKDLGPHDMYLPLKDQCYSLDAGEYTYEVCLLDHATQISNKDNSRQNLGSFAEFGSDASDSTVTDYTIHKYLNGNKCWNGPNRSLIAHFECAEDIKVLSVTEPEKCEYHATVSGPFACPLPENFKSAKPKQEGDPVAAKDDAFVPPVAPLHDEQLHASDTPPHGHDEL
ncbi:hypothetical protein FBU59_001772 [Linderina macrospora]|uniref:Uncharacterized protein n=1 Tax=Linderina macrospora TaxID=4868 RepID=A0ACC1JD82_9FUNG|nr:hypothetical protein FBU59_001772 [Linderina macrospora]